MKLHQFKTTLSHRVRTAPVCKSKKCVIMQLPPISPFFSGACILRPCRGTSPPFCTLNQCVTDAWKVFDLETTPGCREPLPVARGQNWLECNNVSCTTMSSRTRNRPSGSCSSFNQIHDESFHICRHVPLEVLPS